MYNVIYCGVLYINLFSPNFHGFKRKRLRYKNLLASHCVNSIWCSWWLYVLREQENVRLRNSLSFE